MGSIVSHQGVTERNKFDYLKKSKIFGKLNVEELTALASCFRASKKHKGTLLEETPQFLYVGEGELHIFSPYLTEKDPYAQQFLCSKCAGDIVLPYTTTEPGRGRARSFSLSKKPDMDSQDLENTRILCVTNSVVMYLKKNGIDSLLKQGFKDLAEIMSRLTKDVSTYVDSLDFLKDVNSSKLKLLASFMTLETFGKGEAVVCQDDPGDRFYIILHGICQVKLKQTVSLAKHCQGRAARRLKGAVSKLMKSNDEILLSPSLSKKTITAPASAEFEKCIPVAHLREGQYFGEAALMVNIPRTCTIECETECLFASLSKTDFDSFLEFFPDLRSEMQKMVCARLLEQARAMNIQILGAFPPRRLKADLLAEHCSMREYSSGDVVVKKGERVDALFIVLFGTVEMLKPERPMPTRRSTYKNIADGNIYLKKSCSFAEETMGGKPVQYTVVALTNVVLLEIKASILDLIKDDEDLFARFSLCCFKEDAELSQILSDKTACTYLRDFLRSEHTEENLDFITKVNQFKRSFSQCDPSSLNFAAKLITDYILDRAVCQVNITCHTRTEIENLMQAGALQESALSQTMFDTAFQEVLAILTTHCFPRFLASEQYTNLMQTIVRK